MSLSEIQSSISQLPQAQKEDLLRFLTRELQAAPSARPVAAVSREQWLKTLDQLRTLTAASNLRPSQEILDELRADRA